MRVKKTFKKIIDTLMLIAMPPLAAEIQLGQESHEWIGIGMLVLFILHQILNYKWWKGVFKREYTLVRAFMTMLNILLLMDFLALGYSGIKMSGFVLNRLTLPGNKQTARLLHLFASQWGFILMAMHVGVHSGLHSNVLSGGKLHVKAAEEQRITDSGSENGIRSWLVRGIICAVSVFGIFSFIDLKVADYLFMQTHFMFFDETKGLGLYFAEVICMLVLFAAIGHLIISALKKMRFNDTGKKITKVLAFAIPVIICITVIFALNHDSGTENNAPWGVKSDSLMKKEWFESIV